MKKFEVLVSEKYHPLEAADELNEMIETLRSKASFMDVSSPSVTMVGHPATPRYVIAVTVTYYE